MFFLYSYMYVAWIFSFYILYLYSVTVRFYKLQIPIKIWLKIFDSVTLPIVLYGSDIWGPFSH